MYIICWQIFVLLSIMHQNIDQWEAWIQRSDQWEACITWQQPGGELSPQHGRVCGQHWAAQSETRGHQSHLEREMLTRQSILGSKSKYGRCSWSCHYWSSPVSCPRLDRMWGHPHSHPAESRGQRRTARWGSVINLLSIGASPQITWSALTNMRPISTSCDLYWPFRGQYSHHKICICIDRSEAITSIHLGIDPIKVEQTLCVKVLQPAGPGQVEWQLPQLPQIEPLTNKKIIFKVLSIILGFPHVLNSRVRSLILGSGNPRIRDLYLKLGSGDPKTR